MNAFVAEVDVASENDNICRNRWRRPGTEFKVEVGEDAYAHGAVPRAYNATRCSAVAPRTAVRGMRWSNPTRRPPFLTARASR